jgi:hypothetical protein
MPGSLSSQIQGASHHLDYHQRASRRASFPPCAAIVDTGGCGSRVPRTQRSAKLANDLEEEGLANPSERGCTRVTIRG